MELLNKISPFRLTEKTPNGRSVIEQFDDSLRGIFPLPGCCLNSSITVINTLTDIAFQTFQL